MLQETLQPYLIVPLAEEAEKKTVLQFKGLFTSYWLELLRQGFEPATPLN